MNKDKLFHRILTKKIETYDDRVEQRHAHAMKNSQVDLKVCDTKELSKLFSKNYKFFE